MLSTLLIALAHFAAGSPAAAGDLVAVQAGTIHTVDGDRVIEGGGTILIRDGKIVAVGPSAGDGSVKIPGAARVVDYGPGAVLIPGLVDADSTFGGPAPAERSAEAALRAADNFDPYASYARTLAGGVTSAYVVPARGRLIAGQGAVFKLAGAPGPGRALSAAAAIHGSISRDARNTPGYWEPPVPATVDVGMGVEQKQLPRTTMGAIVALRELLALATGGAGAEEYGPYVGAELGALIAGGLPWRMRAESENEIRALLGFFGENGLPLVVDGAQEAAGLADEIARSGASVVLSVPVYPGQQAADRGKSEDDEWPRLDAAAALARAGVRFALATSSSTAPAELRFAALMASRGGLSESDALRAITIAPAEILGVADRVGSLSSGKDADLVVLNGPPLSATASVLATWVDGDVAWKADEAEATVLEVEELHLGDGQVLSPGQVLMDGGRILEVGRRVGHPLGCTVVRGRAAMPGMIDALGFLGLEGSTKVPATRFELKQLVEPGDYADRRVAQAGVTTVLLTPRGVSSSGAPAMAYKPAGVEAEAMVVADPAAMHVQWTDQNRLRSGESVREVLAKAREYKQKWDEYEKAIAEWVPPPPEPEKEAAAGDEKKKGEGEGEGEAEAEKEKAANGGDAKNAKDGKDGKGAEPEEGEGPRPITGVWEGKVPDPDSECGEPRLRLRLLDEGGALEGSLRCDAISSELVDLTGECKEGAFALSGLGLRGRVTASGTVVEPEKPKKKKKKDEDGGEEPPPPKRKLTGKVATSGVELEFTAELVSAEYAIAARPERRKEKTAEEKEPKGKPKSPGINPDLEPYRRAFDGACAVVVVVDRSDEILDCVGAFEKVGIRPVLRGADEAWKVAEKIRGRVAGVLLDHRVVYSDAKMGTKRRNRYAELAQAGIPVAFHSAAEEGAAELPLIAAFAVSQGMSPVGALRALTGDAAQMMAISERVGTLRAGRDADVLLLDGSPLELDSSILRAWVNGREVRPR